MDKKPFILGILKILLPIIVFILSVGVVYYNRGIEYADKEDYDKAITDYESVLRIDPNNSNARKALENLKGKEQEQ